MPDAGQPYGAMTVGLFLLRLQAIITFYFRWSAPSLVQHLLIETTWCRWVGRCAEQQILLSGSILVPVCIMQDLAPFPRNHYADASGTSGSETYAVYAPFSIIPLWNSEGRADQAVVGGTAAPGEDYLCADTGKTRCAEVSLDWGVFPYARSGAAMGSWNGTLLLDKPDAAGTYYRRNRTYDPSTARFTQEDPIGLAGGINEYGFASADPANYGDPFGLCCSSSDVATITSQLAQLAPQMNHEILWFLPKNIAAAATGLSAEAVLGRLAPGARNLFNGETDAASATPGEWAASGRTPDRGGLTRAGRSLAKHAGREGSSFSHPGGGPNELNAAGQNHLESIISDPRRTIMQGFSGRFGNVTDIYSPTGQGARFDSNNQFIHFLEPRR